MKILKDGAQKKTYSVLKTKKNYLIFIKVKDIIETL